MEDTGEWGYKCFGNHGMLKRTKSLTCRACTSLSSPSPLALNKYYNNNGDEKFKTTNF